MKILYVEDDPNDATLVALYARATHHHLVVLVDSREVHTAMNDKPDLVLLDLVLDNVRKGYTIARKLRQDGYTQPIIAVTALATAQDQAECKSVGITEVLTKPYTINQLAHVIDKYTI